MAKAKKVKETKSTYATRARRTSGARRSNGARVSKTRARAIVPMPERRVLGKYVVVDPKIQNGQATLIGTQITVGQVLEKVATGASWDSIIQDLRGEISATAIGEVVRLAAKAFQSKAAELLHPSDQNDVEIINRNAERLNREAMDVLEYQIEL